MRMYAAILTALSLSLFPASQAVAGKVYQWTDEEGGVHLGNVPEEDATTTVAYRKPDSESIYRWTDADGQVHYSDTPPPGNKNMEPREVTLDQYNDNAPANDDYSIVAQAERMAASRRQLEEERLLEKQIRLEERRIAEEEEIIRLNKLLREQGYGQRPFGFPFATVY